MRELKTIATGIRLTPSQERRRAELAVAWGVKRNRVVGILLDSAQVQTGGSVILAGMKNSDSAKFSQDSAITASA